MLYPFIGDDERIREAEVPDHQGSHLSVLTGGETVLYRRETFWVRNRAINKIAFVDVFVSEKYIDRLGIEFVRHKLLDQAAWLFTYAKREDDHER